MDTAAIVTGAYFALVTVFAVGGFGFAFAARDRTYGLFACHALAVGALALTFPPFFPSVDVIEPQFVFWRIHAEGLIIATAGMLIAHMVFSRSLRSLRVWLGVAFPAIVLCGAGGYYLTEAPVILVIYGAVILVQLLAGISTLAYQTIRGSKEAAMLSIAFAPLCAVGIYAAALEVLPVPSMQNYAEATLLAFGFELLFVSVMLAMRLRGTMQERDQALADAKRALKASETDALTGLPNRRAFERELARYESNEYQAIAILDCDRFKTINDDFGHAAGDEVLRAVGDCLHAGNDFAARIGGEEFAMLLRGPDWAVRLETLRARITLSVCRDVPHLPIHVTVSAGAAALAKMTDAQTAMLTADRALYMAKASGRDRLEVAMAHDASLAEAA